jgi:hypothetical protein
MKCAYFNKELDEDRKLGYICSCELGYFEDENPKTAVEQFCADCESKETDSCCDEIEDEDDN